MLDSLEVIGFLFDHGIIQLLGGLIALVVIAFLLLVGFLVYLALREAPKFNKSINQIADAMIRAVPILDKIKDHVSGTEASILHVDDKVDKVLVEVHDIKKSLSNLDTFVKIKLDSIT